MLHVIAPVVANATELLTDLAWIGILRREHAQIRHTDNNVRIALVHNRACTHDGNCRGCSNREVAAKVLVERLCAIERKLERIGRSIQRCFGDLVAKLVRPKRDGKDRISTLLISRKRLRRALPWLSVARTHFVDYVRSHAARNHRIWCNENASCAARFGEVNKADHMGFKRSEEHRRTGMPAHSTTEHRMLDHGHLNIAALTVRNELRGASEQIERRTVDHQITLRRRDHDRMPQSLLERRNERCRRTHHGGPWGHHSRRAEVALTSLREAHLSRCR